MSEGDDGINGSRPLTVIIDDLTDTNSARPADEVARPGAMVNLSANEMLGSGVAHPGASLAIDAIGAWRASEAVVHYARPELSSNAVLEGSENGQTLREELQELKDDIRSLGNEGMLNYRTELDYMHGRSFMPLRDEIEQLKLDINFIKNDLQFIREMVLAISGDSELVKDAVEVKKNAEAMLNALKENKRIIRPKI